jgi:phage terminase Nu1 subunit (DNA packaging protein)
MIVNRFELAEIFGVNAETVRTWHRSGCPVHREPQSGKGVTNDDKARLFQTAQVHDWLVRRALATRWK